MLLNIKFVFLLFKPFLLKICTFAAVLVCKSKKYVESKQVFFISINYSQIMYQNQSK